MLIRSISGVRGITPNHLNDSIIKSYAQAFHSILPDGIIYCGRDSRPSGENFLHIFYSELILLGRDVIVCDIVPTPTIQFMVEKTEAVGGVIITASHNPTDWNGMKFVNAKGTFFDSAQCAELFKIVDQNKQIHPAETPGMYLSDKNANLKHVLKIMELPCVDLKSIRAKGFKIAIDAVNGAGSEAIPLLLENLGCDIVKIYCDPNGIFKRGAEPLPENLSDLSDLVIRENCDIGFAVDPDSDRLAIIDEHGKPLGEEYTLVLAAAGYLSQKENSEVLVTNLSSSIALDKLADKYNSTVLRSAVGEINVVNKMVECNSSFGGEGNGGVILKDAHLGRDALVGAALILSYLSHQKTTLSETHKALPQYVIVKDKINIKNINIKVFEEKVKNLYKDSIVDETDGIKFIWSDKWLHIRKSNTEPIIRIYAEAISKKIALEIIQNLKSIL